ncbi:MAG: sulfotransferase [Bacteroidia bacterium]|nr:sulfotransferase [Bacteroidia bacterium]
MNISDRKLVFIVGNSRSGTTMMMRIISKHPEMHSVNEIHFFEKLWSVNDKDRVIEEGEAIYIASRLIFVKKEGYLATFNPDKYREEARTLVKNINAEKLYSHDVFLAFLVSETEANGKSIPCEKTPQNVFYIQDILDLFPNARVINMIRDPRGVLLSQKKKWMRKDNTDAYLSKHKKEVMRLRVNYHPITISRLWNSSINASKKFEGDPRVLNVRFEDITGSPTEELKRLCAFIGVEYSEKMQQVEYIGSSNEKDTPGKVGIKNNRTKTWMQGGLNRAEIWFCQTITGDFFEKFGYEPIQTKANPLAIAGYYISFPVKLGLALFMNLHRMKNVKDSIRRRLFA